MRLTALITSCLLALTANFAASAGQPANEESPNGGAAASPADLTISGDVGDFVILPCRVGPDSRFDHLRWFGPRFSDIPLTVGDVTFATDSRISLERESRGHEEFLNLVISFVAVQDGGIYRCCCHGNPPAEQTVLLKVIEHPSTTQHIGSKLTTKVPQLVRLGDNVTLECSTRLDSGQQQHKDLDLDWVKPGPWPGAERTRPTKRLSSVPVMGDEAGAEAGPGGARQSLLLTAMLTIPTIRLSDAGVYECRRSVVGNRRGWQRTRDNVARVTLKVHLSRSQHKYFLSTTTPAAVSPTKPSLDGEYWWGSRSRGGSYDESRVLNDGQSQISPGTNQLRSPPDGRIRQQGLQRPPQQPLSPPQAVPEFEPWSPAQAPDSLRKRGSNLRRSQQLMMLSMLALATAIC